MYIKKATLWHIKAISHLAMEWETGKEPGWHVIIGDNGAGKTTVLQAIAMSLLTTEQQQALRQDWNVWLQKQAQTGSIEVLLNCQEDYDNIGSLNKNIPTKIAFQRNKGLVEIQRLQTLQIPTEPQSGFFAASYGSFRRFEGGNLEWNRIFSIMPRLGAHLSIFGEDVALQEALDWLKELDYAKAKNPFSQKSKLFDLLVEFVNQSKLLPHAVQIKGVDDGILKFTDIGDNIISVLELSAGYRSVLSLLFDMLRQMDIFYGTEKLCDALTMHQFQQIPLPGIVMIDEADIHLHPTWQTRIGKWFVKYFPKIQFIVTTHSPLICRACGDNGYIWKLSQAQGTPTQTIFQKLEPEQRNRLVHGDILDAFGTEAFGENVEIDDSAAEQLQRFAELDEKSIFGELSAPEEQEYKRLRNTYITYAKPKDKR